MTTPGEGPIERKVPRTAALPTEGSLPDGLLSQAAPSREALGGILDLIAKDRGQWPEVRARLEGDGPQAEAELIRRLGYGIQTLLNDRGDYCFETAVQLTDPNLQTQRTKSVLVISRDGDATGPLNDFAREIWDSHRALLVIDPERLFSNSPESTDSNIEIHSEGFQIVSLGVNAIREQQIQSSETLESLGLRKVADGEASPHFKPAEVAQLLDARGRLKEFERIFQSDEFAADPSKFEDFIALQNPRWGRTQLEAAFPLSLEGIGDFRAYVFRDVGTGMNTFALVHGDLDKSDTLHTRMHSSCITSETETACDCDCRQQLEKALFRIGQEEAGVLFYLVQEGRGAGIIPKAMDRAAEQATAYGFDDHGGPYHVQGLATDHRSYQSVADILQMFGIHGTLDQKEIMLLTNNDTKRKALEGLSEMGIQCEALEFAANGANVAYLRKKGEAGNHKLTHESLGVVEDVATPEIAVPFQAIALPDAPRFTWVGDYRLPTRPFEDEVVLTKDAWNAVMEDEESRRLIGKHDLVIRREELSGERIRLGVNLSGFAELQAELQDPNHPVIQALQEPVWFKKHVYHDAVTQGEFIVLEHGRPSGERDPMVRLHFDTLLGRIPFMPETSSRNREAFRRSSRQIVDHGHGLIVLMPDDAGGAGLTAQAHDLMLRSLEPARTRQQNYDALGVTPNAGLYDAAARLVRHHAPGGSVELIAHSPQKLMAQRVLSDALRKNGVAVSDFHYLFAKRPEGPTEVEHIN